MSCFLLSTVANSPLNSHAEDEEVPVVHEQGLAAPHGELDLTRPAREASSRDMLRPIQLRVPPQERPAMDVTMESITRAMDKRLEPVLTEVRALREELDERAMDKRLEPLLTEVRALREKVDAFCESRQPQGHQPTLSPEGTGVPTISLHRALSGLTGRVLPDYAMPCLTPDITKMLMLAGRMRADLTARELFKFLVGFERYQQWARVTNWEGNEGKDALPVCLRVQIMAFIDAQFEGSHLAICRQRINEFMRMPRTVRWTSVPGLARRAAAESAPRSRNQPRAAPEETAAGSNTANGRTVQGDSTRLQPASTSTTLWSGRVGAGQWTSTPERHHPYLPATESTPSPQQMFRPSYPCARTPISPLRPSQGSSSYSPLSTSSPSPTSPSPPFSYAHL